MTKEEKVALYEQAKEKIAMYTCVKGDIWARLATVEAVLHQTIPYYFWTGIYVLLDEDLIVRSYQGPVACQLLKRHTGVCWAAIDREETVVVEDVEQFPGHIACSSQSKSEIVVPLRDENGKSLTFEVTKIKKKTCFCVCDNYKEVRNLRKYKSVMCLYLGKYDGELELFGEQLDEYVTDNINMYLAGVLSHLVVAHNYEFFADFDDNLIVR
jgi:GAF domain-containing protein